MRFRYLFIFALLIIIIMSSCVRTDVIAGGNFDIQTENWGIENVEGKSGGILKLAIVNDFSTLLPYSDSAEKKIPKSNILDIYLESLMYISKGGVYSEFGLAKSAKSEVTEDGTTILTFELGENIKWSDGVPLTVNDIKWNFENIWTVEPYSDYFSLIKDSNGNFPEIKIINDTTIQFIYKSKYRRGYTAVASAKILPKHIFEQYSNTDNFNNLWDFKNFNKDLIVGSGAFIPKEYIPREKLVFEKNEYYYRKDKNGNNLPYLDKIIIYFVNDRTELKNMFLSNEIDIYEPLPEEFDSLKVLSDENNWKSIIGNPRYGTNFLAFNFNAKDSRKRKWFRNKHFRLAMAKALNRERIINEAFYNYATNIYGPVSPSSFFYNPEVENLNLDYSLDNAASELVLGGFDLEDGILYDEEGSPVTFEIITNEGNLMREKIGEILKEDLLKLGITVNLIKLPFNDVVGKLVATGEWDSVIIGLTGSADPASGWNVWRLDGGLHFWNYSPELKPDLFDEELKADYVVPEYEKRIDEIFRQSESTFGDELKSIFNEFQMLVAENQILVYVSTPNYLAIYKNNIHISNSDKLNELAGILWKPWNIWSE